MAKRVFRAGHPEPPADVVALYGDLHGQPGRYLVRLAHGGWIWAASPRASGTPGTGASWESQAECATSVLVEMAVTGTATPDDQGELTAGLGDQTQTPAPLSQRPQGTTNAPSPVVTDAGNGTDDLRAELIEALRLAAQTRPEDLGLSVHEQWYVDFNCVDCDAETLYAVLAHGLAAAGWRPPLPEPACTCEYPYDGAPGSGHHPGCDVFGSPLPAGEVEWAFRSKDFPGTVVPATRFAARVAAQHPDLEAVRRTVGPWSVVEPVEPKPEPVTPPPLSSDPGDWKFRGYDQMGLPTWSWAPVEPKETP